MKTADRFYAKVASLRPDNCWNWTGSLSKGDGKVPYGLFWNGVKVVVAHRWIYERYFGPIPEGLKVLHSCDNGKCVNPAHLHLGTQQQNIQEASQRKRLRCGLDNPAAVLTEEQVTEIRTSPLSCAELARRMRTSRQTVWRCRTRRTR